MEKAEPKIYFRNLDVLRFFAATYVAIAHFYPAWRTWWAGHEGFDNIGMKYPSLMFLSNGINQFIENGGFGVDIFFLVSGFLITYLLLKEKEKSGTINIKNFLIRRSLRIWPLYFFILMLSPFIIKWIGNNEQPDFLSVGLFYYNIGVYHTGEWIFPFVHFWSICVEEHFYLIVPFIVKYIKNKHLPLFFGVLIGISVLARASAYLLHIDNLGLFCYLHTISRMDVIAIGSLVGYYHFKKPIQLNINMGIRVLIYSGFIFLLSMTKIYKTDTFFECTFKKYIFVGLALFWILNYLFNEQAFFNFTSKNILHYWGKISYGLYLYHNILIPIVITKIIWVYKLEGFGWYALLLGGLYILIPTISFELFEKHFLRFKERFALIKTER